MKIHMGSNKLSDVVSNILTMFEDMTAKNWATMLSVSEDLINIWILGALVPSPDKIKDIIMFARSFTLDSMQRRKLNELLVLIEQSSEHIIDTDGPVNTYCNFMISSLKHDFENNFDFLNYDLKEAVLNQTFGQIIILREAMVSKMMNVKISELNLNFHHMVKAQKMVKEEFSNVDSMDKRNKFAIAVQEIGKKMNALLIEELDKLK